MYSSLEVAVIIAVVVITIYCGIKVLVKIIK